MPALRSTLDLLSVFIIPLIIIGFPLYGLWKRVPVYEEFVVGAKEGFQVAVNIIPYLVAILFAVAMFRASGAMDFFVEGLRPLLAPLGWPPEDHEAPDGLGFGGDHARSHQPLRRGFDHREDGGHDVRLDGNNVLRDRGVFRGGQHPEDAARHSRRPDRGHFGDDLRGVCGAVALRVVATAMAPGRSGCRTVAACGTRAG